MQKTQFQAFLDEEVKKIKGIYYPVKAGFLRRLFITSLPFRKLHPNPDDEFCSPDIGPNYSIMSRYEQDFRYMLKHIGNPCKENYAFAPLEVEKISPDGYMILNGHHRWGAAHSVGLKKMAVTIVDLTQQKDVEKMLENARSDRRVSLDLDEVVFRPESDPCLEKQLPFPFRFFYKERLRLGIPALFHQMNNHNYDIWVYTANNISLDYLRYYFKHYHLRVTGIVTGTARRGPAGSETKKELENRLNARYLTTVSIGDNIVVRTSSDSKAYDEYPLSGNSETWSREVINAFDEMRKHE